MVHLSDTQTTAVGRWSSGWLEVDCGARVQLVTVGTGSLSFQVPFHCHVEISAQTTVAPAVFLLAGHSGSWP